MNPQKKADTATGLSRTNVFITCDTEIWPPLSSQWRQTGLAHEIARDIWGTTGADEFGIRFQMEVLNRYSLKSVFFIESLFASAVGVAALKSVTDVVQRYGHDVQLHLHPEWLERVEPPLLQRRAEHFMHCYPVDEQTELIKTGLENLKACGINATAFRAGSYGANGDTLEALHRNGILFDSSYSFPFAGKMCRIEVPAPILQPQKIRGVIEFPVTHFLDRPGHVRSFQICACSNAELEEILLTAWRSRWYAVVLVSHSFELVKHRADATKALRPSKILVRRFEHLCKFLHENEDKFRTRTFSEMHPEEVPLNGVVPAPRSPFHKTALRYAEQMMDWMS